MAHIPMIKLDAGDIVVAAVSMRDFVLVFTQRGAIFKVSHDYERLSITVEELP